MSHVKVVEMCTASTSALMQSAIFSIVGAPKNVSESVGDAAVFLGNTRAIRFISAAPFFSISLHSVTAFPRPQCRRRGSVQFLSPDIPPVLLPRIPDTVHIWCGIPLSASGSPVHMAASRQFLHITPALGRTANCISTFRDVNASVWVVIISLERTRNPA